MKTKILLVIVLMSAILFNSDFAKAQWGLTGNSITVSNFLGSTNNSSLRFRVNNTQKMILDSTGSIGIGTATPNASSLLDISSTTKGMLVPRMTKSQLNAIVSPATGLLVYQTDNTSGFYYFNGTVFTALKPTVLNRNLNNLMTPTAANVELLPGNDNTLNLGSISKSWKDLVIDGSVFLDGAKFLDNSGSNNTFIGNTGITAVTGHDNTATGFQALKSVTTGYENTATGVSALSNNQNGNYNSAFGYLALSQQVAGTSNTAVGAFALQNNDGGFGNMAIGEAALLSNTQGYRNTACGQGALGLNINGSNNTACGQDALQTNTNGNYNTALGYYAMQLNTTGTGNTALGDSTGVSASNLVNATAIGSHALVGASNSLVLGSIAGVNGATSSVNVGIGTSNPALSKLQVEGMVGNTVAIFKGSSTSKGLALVADNPGIYFNCYFNGNNKAMAAAGFPSLINTATAGGMFFSTSTVANTVADATISLTERMRITAAGNVGIGTSTPSQLLTVFNGTTTGTYTTTGWVHSSDARLKTNIKPLESSLDKIVKLQGVSYNWKQTPASNNQIGFIAQEVEKVFPEVIVKDQEGNYSMAPQNLTAPIVEAIKEQQKQIETKDETIKSLQSTVEQQQKQIDGLINQMQQFDMSLSRCCMNYRSGAGSSEFGENSNNDIARLEQNTPNPFSEKTVIKFYIPQNSGNGVIKIYSIDGFELKSIPVSTKGFGQVEITGKTFSAGTYTYMLLVDGKVIDTRQMIFTK